MSSSKKLSPKDLVNKPIDFRLKKSEWRNQEIGGFFRAKRLAAGLTQQAVCAEIDVADISTLEAYEQGALAIPLTDICALSNALNIAPDEVMELISDLSDSLASTEKS